MQTWSWRTCSHQRTRPLQKLTLAPGEQGLMLQSTTFCSISTRVVHFVGSERVRSFDWPCVNWILLGRACRCWLMDAVSVKFFGHLLKLFLGILCCTFFTSDLLIRVLFLNYSHIRSLCCLEISCGIATHLFACWIWLVLLLGCATAQLPLGQQRARDPGEAWWRPAWWSRLAHGVSPMAHHCIKMRGFQTCQSLTTLWAKNAVLSPNQGCCLSGVVSNSCMSCSGTCKAL